jgi:hypothetical protein
MEELHCALAYYLSSRLDIDVVEDTKLEDRLLYVLNCKSLMVLNDMSESIDIAKQGVTFDKGKSRVMISTQQEKVLKGI